MPIKKIGPIDAEIGARIRGRRLEMGLSQHQLGRAIGMSVQQIGKYEAGDHRVAASTLVRLAFALQTTVSLLVEDPDDAWPEGFDDLLFAYQSIKDPEARRAAVLLARSLAGLRTPADAILSHKAATVAIQPTEGTMDIREIVSGIASSGALGDPAGEAGLDTSQAQGVLHGVLEHFDNGGSLEGAAEAVAAKAGVSPGQVQAFLPQVLPLLQGHAENADEGLQSVLGGMVNSLSSGGLGGLAKGLPGG